MLFVLAAVMIVIVAVGLLAWLLQPAPAPTTQPVDASPPQPAAFSLPIRPELETTVSVGNIAEVGERIQAAAERTLRADPKAGLLGVEAKEKLVEAAREHAEIVLSGDADRWMAHTAETNARWAFLDEATDDAARTLRLRDIRETWAFTAAPYALKPISLDEVRVRVRFVRGEPVASPDDGAVTAYATAPERWPRTGGEPSESGLTVAELLVPVFYAEPPEIAGTVYLGIWFAWDQDIKEWRINRMLMYNPQRLAGRKVPLW